ncbi:MAG: glucosamine-6-phosphate deaminase [Cyclobacteriaceae bacterium]|nr:glucosamine-6-phosphate deaminase [Cyclobacteriaceae bacterium]
MSKKVINPMADGNLSHYNFPNSSDLKSFLRFEKIPTLIYKDSVSASRAIASEVASIIKIKQLSKEKCLIAFATGSTMVTFYEELIRLHKKEQLSFRHVIAFTIDEFYPMDPSSIQSYARFMHEHLFDHIDIEKTNIHIPDGSLPKEKVNDFCHEYERLIDSNGGLDIIIQGVSSRGHTGFNEPGSPTDSKTRLVTLDRATITAAASDFYGEKYVPGKAITMGIETMFKAKKVLLLAWGEGKAPIIKKIVEGQKIDQIPASILQDHPDATVVLDEASADDLTRVKTPWIVDIPKWDNMMIKKAVVWLCQEVQKPLLKLTTRDYNDHHMNDLVTEVDTAYDINIRVFNELQNTITGWPGGKPNADDSRRPERALPAKKRVIIFSPHPDDDVISMGGTFIRLVDQGHDVHVAYQTSGNIAVFDEDVIQLTDFFKEIEQVHGVQNKAANDLYKKVNKYIKEKKPGEADKPEVKVIKGLIRRAEARAGCRYVGLTDDKAHFLDLPFYETGQVKKNPVGPDDVKIIKDLLMEIRPHQVYAAGDLSDPHGTHRVCLNAIFMALDELKNEPWINDCWVWLYRGAWHEWPVDEIEMAVPMSPGELMRKRKAIFKHQSQKDSALFPGTDAREFWQRAEDRNKGLANIYDQLGLAEYEAMEGFKRHHFL